MYERFCTRGTICCNCRTGLISCSFGSEIDQRCWCHSPWRSPRSGRCSSPARLGPPPPGSRCAGTAPPAVCSGSQWTQSASGPSDGPAAAAGSGGNGSPEQHLEVRAGKVKRSRQWKIMSWRFCLFPSKLQFRLNLFLNSDSQGPVHRRSFKVLILYCEITICCIISQQYIAFRSLMRGQ